MAESNNWTSYGYSATGRRNSAKNMFTGANSILTINADGTVATSTTPENVTSPQQSSKSTIYTYVNRQLTKVTPPQEGTLEPQEFTYDGAGRLWTSKSEKGVVSTYTYDAMDRVKNISFNDSTHSIAMDYDLAGNLTSRTDASGTTVYTYDDLNRLGTKDLPSSAFCVTATTLPPISRLRKIREAPPPTVTTKPTSSTRSPSLRAEPICSHTTSSVCAPTPGTPPAEEATTTATASWHPPALPPTSSRSTTTPES